MPSASECASLYKIGLIFLIAAQCMASVCCCNMGSYESKMNELCLATFTLDLEDLEQGLWCSWPRTLGKPPDSSLPTEYKDTVKALVPYEALTNCTFQVALSMNCFWPNEVVDRFFMEIHRTYFEDCALTGRLLHDPPISVLGPFIAVPVLVTLLITALVVWRSKRSQGVL